MPFPTRNIVISPRLNSQGTKSILAVVVIATAVAFGEEAETVDFKTEIEPVFAEHCIKCHGADKQKGEFRVDRLARLLRGGNSGEAAVVPGDPAGSFLVKLIKHEEGDLKMPPKGEPLAADQIARISQWIAEGAKTPDSYGPAQEKVELTHWSFLPVKRPDSDSTLDGIIISKLTESGLKPSPTASRRTQIRRLYLVMLGLPPTSEQVAAFESDERPDAWPRLVEDVLARPQYGERWAAHWLDLARFGETHGFEMNRERPHAWRYRDWVIQSFNDDKPYNAFVREQIAGDVLGVPIGTSFLVAGPVDQVKGQDPKLGQIQRMNELDDIINTTSTAFLGLTAGCARCHNHKFDPITQKDYYSMQAVFAGVHHGDQNLPLQASTKAEIAALSEQMNRLSEQLNQFRPNARKAQGQAANSSPGASLRRAVNAQHNIDKFKSRETKFVRFTIEAAQGGSACIDEIEIFSGTQNVALARLGAKVTSSGDFVHPLHKLEQINDGEFGNGKSWIAARNTGWVQIELPELTQIDRIEWGRDRTGTFTDRLAVGYRIEAARELGKWQLLASSADRAKSPAGQPQQPAKHYEFDGHPDAAKGRKWLDELNDIKGRKYQLENSTMAYVGTFRQPGPTHRLYRGEPDAKRERVGPGGISALASLDLPLDAPEQDRRLAFANWVAADDNPLTARVIVNRLWQFHFGAGIVDTPSDLGRNGTPPNNPQLLDWLAAELVSNDWSLKHVHRLILTSTTWRQDSQSNPTGLRVDAASRLLWRFPTRRLEAEGIRDSILLASGVLDTRAGGPGFSAFKVDKENVRHYHPKESYGPSDWRRMIYMTKVRQERDSVFGTFDCPDASQTVPARSRSTTPLQAMGLFNSTFVLQQANLLSKRLQAEADTDVARVNRAWQLCFQRPPDATELAASVAFIKAEGLVQFCRATLNTNELAFIP
jgi:mono/diheme cytochrome c family protein